jgi:hypothetical protein
MAPTLIRVHAVILGGRRRREEYSLTDRGGEPMTIYR